MAIQDIAGLPEEKAIVQDGMQLLAENWSSRQQWSGTHMTDEPVSTTVALRSLIFKDPQPSEEQVQQLLGNAIGPNGFATPAAMDEGYSINTAQPLWHIEFDSLEARQEFTERLASFKAQQQGTTVEPARLDSLLAVPSQEVELAV